MPTATNPEARSAILGRIRSILAKDAPPRVASEVHPPRSDPPRTYRQHGELSPGARLDLLEARLRDYDADVTRLPPGAVASTAGGVLRARGAEPALLPAGFPEVWRPREVLTVVDDQLSPRELDRFPSAVITASLAIAQTGTLVLHAGPGEGRRAITLVPDFCLCLVHEADVVETVPEAFARLYAVKTCPITFISGPSATADIEMTRIKGVHGPRFLHVFLITGDEPLISM